MAEYRGPDAAPNRGTHRAMNRRPAFTSKRVSSTVGRAVAERRSGAEMGFR
jgi:hypothetical protein